MRSSSSGIQCHTDLHEKLHVKHNVAIVMPQQNLMFDCFIELSILIFVDVRCHAEQLYRVLLIVWENSWAYPIYQYLATDFMVVQTLIILVTLLEYIKGQCGYKVNMSFIDALGHDWHLEHRQIKGNQRGQVLTGSKLVIKQF